MNFLITYSGRKINRIRAGQAVIRHQDGASFKNVGKQFSASPLYTREINRAAFGNKVIRIFE